MPRYARPHVTGGLFHVISRFHNREFLLDKPGSRERYLSAIGKAAERYDTRVLAYCLMSSHVHLVLQLGKDPLGAFMRSVNTGWAIWLNKTFNRIGTTLANRPRSVFCDSETYALDLVRYVHNNPVRAGLVEKAGDSLWSSHRFYLGGGDVPPSWLDIEPILARFSGSREEVSRLFDTWVNEGKKEERRPELSGALDRNLAKHIRALVNGPVEFSYPILGPDSFIVEAFGKQKEHNDSRAQFQNSQIGAMDLLGSVCQICDLKREDVLGRSRARGISRARRLTAWIWCEHLFYSQVDIAELFSLKPSAISQMLGKMRKDGREDEEKQTIELILNNLRERILSSKNAQKAMSSGEMDQVQHLLLQRFRNVDENLKT